MFMNNGKILRFLSNNRLLDFTVRGAMLLPVRRGHSLQKLGKTLIGNVVDQGTTRRD